MNSKVTKTSFLKTSYSHAMNPFKQINLNISPRNTFHINKKSLDLTKPQKTDPKLKNIIVELGTSKDTMKSQFIKLENRIHNSEEKMDDFDKILSKINHKLAHLLSTKSESESKDKSKKQAQASTPIIKIYQKNTQNISSNNIFLDSNVVYQSTPILIKGCFADQIADNCLFSSLQIKSFSLLFKASAHNFQANKFHLYSDNKGPTIVFIKSSSGEIFGGYTPLDWSCKTGFVKDTNESKRGFLFSITNQAKLNLNKAYYAIHNHSSFGPRFGCGGDIYLSNECDKNWDSHAVLGKAYDNFPPSNTVAAESAKYIAGSEYFKVLEYEVYAILF